MPEDWKTYKLGDLISIRGGFSYKGKEIGSGHSLLIGMGCVSNSKRFLISGARPYSGDCRSVFWLYPGDIVLATRQQSENLPIIGQPAIIPSEFANKLIIGGTNLYLVKNDSEIDNRYLYWLLRSPGYLNHIKSLTSGTTVRMITKDTVESFMFSCPKKVERDAIADFLWEIDDKIELNLQMNKTLEDMAMALYKNWFVDFEPFQDGEFLDSELGEIPKGWGLKLLNELGTIFYGKMPKKDKLQNEGFPVYSGYKNVGFYPIYNCDKGKIIVVARGVGGTGDVKMTAVKCFLTNISICINNEKGHIDDNLLFFGLKRHGLDYLRTGSAQPQITINDLNKVSVLIPPKEIQMRFLSFFKPLLLQIELNLEENQTLTQLRDTLLPKLISGEVRVKDVEKTLS